MLNPWVRSEYCTYKIDVHIVQYISIAHFARLEDHIVEHVGAEDADVAGVLHTTVVVVVRVVMAVLIVSVMVLAVLIVAMVVLVVLIAAMVVAGVLPRDQRGATRPESPVLGNSHCAACPLPLEEAAT